MEPISTREYQLEVKRIAREVSENSIDENRDVMDVLHERIDGHQWVIYTYYNMYVLVNTKNLDAITDNGHEVTHDDRVDYAAIAYHALMADVQEAM